MLEYLNFIIREIFFAADATCSASCGTRGRSGPGQIGLCWSSASRENRRSDICSCCTHTRHRPSYCHRRYSYNSWWVISILFCTCSNVNQWEILFLSANPNVVVAKPAYPRWYLRKRFWTRPRKIVYVAPTATADTQSSPSDIVGGLFANAVGDGGVIAAGKTSYASESFIDSIFNVSRFFYIYVLRASRSV